MILFVSGRCDIPAHFHEWLFNRFQAGFVDVRNPYHSHQISRIYLNQHLIDCIVFCTKNPIPLSKRLDDIPFPYLIHITFTAYHDDIEPNLPNKKAILSCIITTPKRRGMLSPCKGILRYRP